MRFFCPHCCSLITPNDDGLVPTHDDPSDVSEFEWCDGTAGEPDVCDHAVGTCPADCPGSLRMEMDGDVAAIEKGHASS